MSSGMRVVIKPKAIGEPAKILIGPKDGEMTDITPLVETVAVEFNGHGTWAKIVIAADVDVDWADMGKVEIISPDADPFAGLTVAELDAALLSGGLGESPGAVMLRHLQHRGQPAAP